MDPDQKCELSSSPSRSALRFPIQYVSQPDQGFRKSKILNQAIRISSAPYLIFIDADCIPHRNFVRAHFDHQSPRAVLLGRRVNLSPQMSRTLTPQDILAGKLEGFSPGLIVDALRRRAGHLEEGLQIENQTLRRWLHRAEPVLFGCNFSLPKALLEEVNGFNEEFEGYWGEDTELGYRLRADGAGLRWVRHSAIQYHLHHPQRSKTDQTSTLLERARTSQLPVCRHGLRELTPEEIQATGGVPPLSKEVSDYLVAGQSRASRTA